MPRDVIGGVKRVPRTGSQRAQSGFAENLRRHRAEAGISQERLGFLCGLHRTEISLLERGERDPRLSTVVRLARGLGVSVGELLDGVD